MRAGVKGRDCAVFDAEDCGLGRDGDGAGEGVWDGDAFSRWFGW